MTSAEFTKIEIGISKDMHMTNKYAMPWDSNKLHTNILYVIGVYKVYIQKMRDHDGEILYMAITPKLDGTEQVVTCQSFISAINIIYTDGLISYILEGDISKGINIRKHIKFSKKISDKYDYLIDAVELGLL